MMTFHFIHVRRWFGCVAAAFSLTFVAGTARGDVNYSTAGSVHTEEFNSLSATGTSNPWTDDLTIPGWFSNRSTYAASDGSVSASGIFSFGNNADRALGTTATAGNTALFGIRLLNDTGETLTRFGIAFDGEQWSQANTNNPVQKLDFAYLIGTGIDESSTGFLDVNEFDFHAPVPLHAPGGMPLDGNDPANRTAGITHFVDDIVWNPGEQLFLRWADFNDPNGGDHGLAIDNFGFAALSTGTFEWSNPTNGIFSTASNWTRISGAGDPPPGDGDEAHFNEAGNYTVTFTANARSELLNVSAGDVTFRSSGTDRLYEIVGSAAEITGAALTLGVSGDPLHLTVGSELQIDSGGTLNMDFGSIVTAGALEVGPLSGAGTLNVLAGSILQAANINVGTTTSPTVEQAVISVDGVGSNVTMAGTSTLTVGSQQNANVEATIDVTNGATFDTGTGVLTVNATGTINIGTGTFPGRGTFNANGDVLVDGGVINTLIFGEFHVAAGRNVTVQNAGHLHQHAGQIELSAGSMATVTGEGSTWTTRASEFDVGHDGDATLTISEGGSVTGAREGRIGVLAGSHGTVTVSGEGSTWTVEENIFVGQGGDGSVNVASGGAVSSLGGLIAGAEGAGTVTVSGDGSVWANTDDFGVGFFGPGTLTITEGGEVNNTDGLVGIVGEDAVGNVLVSGNGARWTNRGDLDISFDESAVVGGVAGTGELTIESGGTVFVGETLRIWDKGTVNLHGGTIRFDVLERSPLATFNYLAGTVQLAGDRTIGSDAVIEEFFGAAPTISAAKGLAVEGTATLLAPLTLDGGTLRIGQLAGAPLLDLKRGTFRLTNQAVAVEVGGLFGDRLQLKPDLVIIVDQGIANSGLIYGNGVLGGPLNNTAAGEIRAEAGSTLTFTGPAADNSGEVRLLGGIVDFQGPLANTASGRITSRGTLIARGGLANQGHVALSAGISDVYGDVANDTGSAATGITVSGNADATFWGDVTNTSGLFRVSAGSSATFFGSYSGGGISGSGDLYFEADIAPGSSPGLAAFGGNVHFGELARLEIEIGGATPGEDYDQLQVAGSITLGGTLEIVLIDDFMPSASDAFELIEAESIVGAFENVVVTSSAGSGTFDISYTPNGLMISEFIPAGLPGDFNGDGFVNAADYVVWRKGGGTSDGYNTWRANFGNSVGAASRTAPGPPRLGGPTAAVPEPASVILLFSILPVLRRASRRLCA